MRNYPTLTPVFLFLKRKTGRSQQGLYTFLVLLQAHFHDEKKACKSLRQHIYPGQTMCFDVKYIHEYYKYIYGSELR